MYGNSRFRQASKAETPQFAAAAGRQGQLDNDAQMQENSQLSNNLMGAGKLYNDGMGDKTPLYDLLADAFGPDETVNALRSGVDWGVDLGAGAGAAAPVTAAMEQQMAEELAARQAAQNISVIAP